jgi:excisionase family DNA binding protein
MADQGDGDSVSAIKFLTVAEVAATMRVSKMTVYRLVHNGTLGSVIKKRRKRMAKKKHRKLLKKTRVQRRRLGK